MSKKRNTIRSPTLDKKINTAAEFLTRAINFEVLAAA